MEYTVEDFKPVSYDDTLPQTIEQKLDEAIQDYEAGNIYTEEELWKLMSTAYEIEF